MGSHYYASDLKFFLPVDKHAEALERFQKWRKEKDDDRPSMSLEEELRLWGFEYADDEMGNICGVYPSDSKMQDEDHYAAFFSLLAPSVRDGSFLQYYGEEGELWGWKFRTDPATGQVKASVEDVYGVFESDLTPEQRVHYVEDFEGGSDG